KDLLIKNRHLLSPRIFELVSQKASITYYVNTEQSFRFFKAAVETAILLDDNQLTATAYYSLGRAYYRSFRIDEAIETFLKSQGYFELSGNREKLINVHGDLALIYLYKGEYEKAKQHALQSFSLYGEKETDDLSATLRTGDYGIASSFIVLANLDARSG